MVAALTQNPQRQCLVDRQPYDKSALLRFVVGPEGELVPDVAGKLPGRGMWLRCNRAVLNEALKKQLFSRAARRSIRVPDGTPELIEALLRERVLAALSLAKKAGEALSGYEKVRQALFEESVSMLLHAADASEDGIRKLQPSEPVPSSLAFSRDELSQRLGVEHAVHVAILHGKAGKYFIKEWQRFAGFIEESSI